MAGTLWVVAAMLAIAATLTFRIDPVQVVVTLAAGLVAAALGLWIFARPTTAAITLSNLAGVGWLVLYGTLTFLQSDEVAAWATDVFLALFGLAAAGVAYRAKREVSAVRTS
jgi:hypothetical protein